MNNKIAFIVSCMLGATQTYAQDQRLSCDSTCIVPQIITVPKAQTTPATSHNGGVVSWKGKCGTANGQTFTNPPSNPPGVTNYFCSSGSASAVTTSTTTYDWTCTGADKSVAYCAGNRPYVPTPTPTPTPSPATCQESFTGTPLPPCPYFTPAPQICLDYGYNIQWDSGRCGYKP